MQSKTNVKNLTVSALLTALAILIPMYMPIKIKLEPIFSATLASHVPGIMAMFISPAAVIGTAIGSALGFFSVLGPWVAARAMMHLFFGLFGYYMIKNNYNIFLTIILTAIVHAASEMLIGWISLPYVAVPAAGALKYVLVTVGLGTFLHHCIDFAVVMAIYKPLQSAKILPGPLTYKKLKG